MLCVGKLRQATRAENFSNPIDIIDVVRQQNFGVVRNRQQAPVEHPVNRSRQCEAILDHVRPFVLNGLDVRRFDLGSSAAVDELKSGEGAAAVVCLQHSRSKNAVADRSFGEHLNAVLLELIRHLLLGNGSAKFDIRARQQFVVRIEPEADDPIEVFGGNWANRRLRAARNIASLIKHASLRIIAA